MGKIPLITVSGTNYDIGFLIGSKLKKDIKFIVDSLIDKNLSKKKLDSYLTKSKKYLDYTNAYFPNLINELKGMSDGSGVSFDKLFLLNLEELFLDYERCTSIVLRDRNKIFLYNNEDFDKIFNNRLAIVNVKLNSGVNFLSIGFPGLLLGSSVSINSYNLIQAINSLCPKDNRLGVPKNFIARAILECKNINDAINLIARDNRASGYNHVLIQEDQIINIECTAKNYFVSIPDDLLIYTNHYVFSSFKDAEKLKNSIGRYNYAKKTLNSHKLNKDLIKKVIGSHDKKYPICDHGNKKSNSCTLASIFIDCKTLKMCVSNGNVCKNKYNEYSL